MEDLSGGGAQPAYARGRRNPGSTRDALGDETLRAPRRLRGRLPSGGGHLPRGTGPDHLVGRSHASHKRGNHAFRELAALPEFRRPGPGRSSPLGRVLSRRAGNTEVVPAKNPGAAGVCATRRSGAGSAPHLRAAFGPSTPAAGGGEAFSTGIR